MANRNVTARNAPHKIDAVNYTPATEVISATAGQGGSPRNKTGFYDRLNSICFDVEWTIGAEATNAILITAQLLDTQGRNLGRYASITFSVHDSDVNGADYGAVSTSAETLAVTTGTLLATHVAGDILQVLSDSDGKIAMTLTESTGADYYKVLVLIGDRVFQSPLITFAA